MKGSAQFLLELLVEDPKHHWLVTPFSMSPEHGYHDSNGQLAFLSPAPTLDVAVIRELFPHCIEAGKLLGVDEEFRARLEAALARMPPYRINRRGFLQEWIEDWEPGNQGHNVSPDFPFYPGSSITLRGNPELSRAIGNWMETRRPRGGWPTAWDLRHVGAARTGRSRSPPACGRSSGIRSRLTCTTRARISRTATSATRRAWPRHCSRVMRARSACCPRCRPAGPTARSRASGHAAASKSSMRVEGGKAGVGADSR